VSHEQCITKVWIEPGCTACKACVCACPDIFEMGDDTAAVCVQAKQAAFLATLPSRPIIDAAKDCPAGVIRVTTDASNTSHIESASADDASDVSRRSILGSTGWLALGGSACLSGLAFQRFLFPNTLAEPDPVLRVGPLKRYADLPVGNVVDHLSDQGVWIIRLSDRIAALSTVCTHLGCLTYWDADAQRFRCPCHGSSFARTGTQIEGPAPRALDRLAIRVENETVVIDRSQTFRFERGQWDDPSSFVFVPI